MNNHIKYFNQFINENKSETFSKWFGESKILYNNKPMVVYHGSSEDFSEFYGDTFFTDDYFNADGYAGEDGFVYEVYLSIKNPLILECNDKKWDEIETPYGNSTIEVLSNVDRSKYDGIIFNNIKDAWFDDEEYQDSAPIYVTFKPNQIKSVDNDGTFDIDDNDIYS